VVNQGAKLEKQKQVKPSIRDVTEKQMIGGRGHEATVVNANSLVKTQIYMNGNEISVVTRMAANQDHVLVPRPVPGSIRATLVVAAEVKNQMEVRPQMDRTMERKRRRKIKTENEVVVTGPKGVVEVKTSLQTDEVEAEVGIGHHILDVTSLLSLLSSMAGHHSRNSSFHLRTALCSTNGPRVIRLRI